MSLVCKIKNKGSNVTSWALNGVLNSSKVDYICINPFHEETHDIWEAIPDIWFDHKKWTSNIIFESYHNHLLKKSFEKNLHSHRKQIMLNTECPLEAVIEENSDKVMSESQEIETENEDILEAHEEESLGNLVLREKEEKDVVRESKESSNLAVDMRDKIFDSFYPRRAKEEFVNLNKRKQRVLSEVDKEESRRRMRHKTVPKDAKILVDLNDYNNKRMCKTGVCYKNFRDEINEKKRRMSMSTVILGDSKENSDLVDEDKVSKLSLRSIHSSVDNSTPTKKSTLMSAFPFKIDQKNFETEFEYFKYLQCKYFLVYFDVFKECVKSNFDIFKFVSQTRLIIKFNLVDLGPSTYKKTWLQLQKLKTRYPFVNIFLEIDEEVLDNKELMRLFTAENLIGVGVCGLDFEQIGKKFKALNKSYLAKISKFIEQDYLIMLEIDNVELEHEKFFYLDAFRKSILKKLSETRKMKRKMANSVVRQVFDLKSDLNSASYSLYEKDRFKYFSYENAIAEKLKNFEFKKVTIAIIGAGRGGLLLAAARALSKITNIVLDKIVLLEKNSNCKFSLKEVINKNAECKDVRAKTIAIFKDARCVSLDEFGGVKADLVISEMIGSFGCNDLSPDTILRLAGLVKEQTEYIPQKIKSFVEPIGGQPLVNQISEPNVPLLCTPRNFHFSQEDSHECFVFDHKQKIQLCQTKNFEFSIQKLGLFHGFFGYFELELSDSVKLTNYPNEGNKLDSWGPFYIPIDMTFVVEKGTKINLDIVRNISRDGIMWYEWRYAVVRDGVIERQSNWFNKGGIKYRVFHFN